MAISRANVAVQIMRHLCTCPEHGYSQPGRFGTSGYCNVATDAGTIQVKKGDRDCSSAVCEAWELALKGTPYEGKITRYHYTGDMRSVFVGSGLFSWKPMSFNASPGDIYLDEENHTAMCIQNDGSADLLGEFSIAETGGIDGEPGDQTGRESSIHGYYEAWDGILHYNGNADGGAASGGSSSGGSSGSSKKNLPTPRYRVAIMRGGDKRWLNWMEGLYCTGNSGDDFAGIAGEPIVDIEVDEASLGGGWYKKHMKGGKLVALTVYYKTPEPSKTGYYLAKYRVHWLGANPRWGKWEYDDTDDYAGNMSDAIDMVQLTICKA